MLLLDGLGPQLPLTRPFLHFPADEGLTLQHLAKLLSQSADLGNVDLLLLFFPYLQRASTIFSAFFIVDSSSLLFY
jgi:hypothetical protein